MKNVFFILISLSIIAFGGKYYIETQYKKELNKVIELAKPYGEFEYRNISIGFDGSLSIHDLSFKNLAGSGSLNVEKAKITTSDKLFVLRGKSIVKNNQIPDSLKIDFDDVIIDSFLIDPKAENACTSLHTAFNFTGVGINRLYSDVGMIFDFKNKTDAKAIITYKDQTAESDLKFSFSTNDISSGSLNNNLPIDDIEINASLDPTLAIQFNEFCAQKLGLTVNKYLSDVVASPKFSFDSFGYNFGDQASIALSNLLQGGQNINILSTPSQQLKSLQALNSANRKSIAQGLNLSVKLDGQPVEVKTETNNNFVSKKAIETKNKLSLESQIKLLEPKKRAYIDDSASNLSNLINQRVKIWRNADKARIDGRVESFSDNIAFIEIRKLGGKVVYKVPVDEIAKVQVFR